MKRKLNQIAPKINQKTKAKAKVESEAEVEIKIVIKKGRKGKNRK